VTQLRVERYVRLGLQLGRHVEGIVDAYYGPPELAAAVDAEPPVDPRTLVAEAETLLDELEDGWLRDQVVGLCTYAGVLAGESVSYADEVEGCYGVRPHYTDEAVFTAAHEQLEVLLPDGGTLAERYERWQSSSLVPADQVERLLAAGGGDFIRLPAASHLPAALWDGRLDYSSPRNLFLDRLSWKRSGVYDPTPSGSHFRLGSTDQRSPHYTISIGPPRLNISRTPMCEDFASAVRITPVHPAASRFPALAPADAGRAAPRGYLGCR
jgi:hypothetical protein